MSWIREVVAFIVSLCREWVVLLTGGALTAGFVIWSNVSGKPIPLHVGWIFLSLTLIASAFLSWRKQWREAEKNFVQIGPAALMKLREGKTSPHANTILKPYIGKRIKVTGTFSDVGGIFPGIKTVHLHCEGVLIGAHVPFWTAMKFVPLPKDEVITVRGTITQIDALWIAVSGIEIVPNPLIAADTPPIPKPDQEAFPCQ
jgi:hypothetical protein